MLRLVISVIWLCFLQYYVTLDISSNTNEMAQYMKKYRKVMKDVRQWMSDDIVSSEYVRLPIATEEESTDYSEDVCVQCDELLCQSGHVSDTGSDVEPLSSSDDEAQLISDGSSSLQTDLAQFMVTENLTRRARDRLLDILRKQGLDLPKDSRTLLKTPRVVQVTERCGGQYAYLGLQKCLNMADKCDVYELSINSDGMQLYKSSNKQVWPILCQVNASRPMLVALYVGTGKPNSIDNYLCDLVTEIKELQSSGFVPCDESVAKQVVVRSFVCDAPARAFLKNIKAHNSLHGCERCTAVGRSTNNRTTFGASECFGAEKRTHDKFVNLQYMGSHQVAGTPLSEVVGDCVSMFALDYMHLVCLGVVRRMLQFWRKGDRIVRLSSSQMLMISEKLCALREFIPSEFARRPRSLVEMDRWKATEYRQFLLYTGPVVLKSILTPQLYKHFLCLSVSISIMLTSDKEKREAHLDYACRLLKHFVANCEDLYGNDFLVYNIHSLLHLGDDVKYFGACLDAISAFSFESFLQTLRRLIRCPSNPISQVLKRVHEFESASCSIGGLPYVERRMKVAANGRDSVIMLKSGKFAEVVDVTDDGLLCEVYRRSCLQPFYTEPCSSDINDVVLVTSRVGCSVPVEIAWTDIARKAMKLPHGQGYVLMPVLHNEWLVFLCDSPATWQCTGILATFPKVGSMETGDTCAAHCWPLLVPVSPPSQLSRDTAGRP